MMWALDFTLNSVTMLALVLMVGIVIDDAIVVLENIFRFVEEKKHGAVRGGARGDRRDRPGRAGHDALAGRDLRAGLVHVEHLGPLPLPVRHHRGGGDPGQPARVVHADADDERAAARAADAARPAATTRRRSRGGLLRLDRPRLHARCSAGRMRHRVVVAVRRASLVIALGDPALPRGQAGVHPHRRRRGRVRGERHRARGHEPGRDGRGHARASRSELTAMPGVRIGAVHGRRRLPRRRQPGRRLRAHRAARGAHLLAARGSGEGIVTLRSAGGVPRQLHAARRDAGDARSGCASIRDLRISVRNIQSFNIGGGNCRHRLRHPRARARGARRATPSELRDARRRARRHRRRRHHAASSTSPSCASRSTATRAADLGVDTERHRHGAAPDGRRRRGGLALPRPVASTRTTTSSCASTDGDRNDAGDDLAPATCRVATASWCGSTTWCTIERGDEPVAHRPARPPAPGHACAPASRPGYALADRIEALRGAVARDEPAAGLHDRASPGAAASWSGRSASSSGRSCSRSSSCT